MHRSYRAAGLFTLALTLTVVALALFGPAEAFAAAVPAHAAHPGFVAHLLDGMTLAGPFALAGLRRHEADLSTRAAAKAAEVVEGMETEAVRAIETEHAAMLTELEGVRAEIRTLETAPTPAPVPAPVPAADQAAERQRAAAILEAGKRSGMPQDVVNAAVADGTSAAVFSERAFNFMADKSEAHRTGQGTRAQIIGADDLEKRGTAIENAILHRYAPGAVQLSEHGRQYRGLTLLEMGSDMLEARGIRTRGMSKHERAQHMLSMRSDATEIAIRSGGAMTTADFPNVLANVANKTLRMGYEAAPQTFRPLVRVVTVPDFKPVSRTQLGEAPKLEKVNEKGEFKRGAMGDAAERYAIATYGKIVSITRNVIINDDLDAFTRIPRAFGVSAANLESDLVWGVILANAAMGDGNALFSAAHNNVGTGVAISTAGVGAGRQAMRVQTGLDGKTLLNISPTYIIVPTALETLTEQFLGQIYPTKTGDAVTESMRKLKPISEPRLDNGVTVGGVNYAGSGTNWYLAGDPAQIDTIELAYLEGMEGLYTETKMGFETDGVEVKVRQDVGAKSIDWRSFWRSAA
ncbi:phage major capsid protein [Methylobacterium fujisawaense]|uniref:phage major capsid protein n=1 Tax=Methylobacterium fujisawaense TaxID=107400 RepID=UPI00313B411F